MAGKGSEVTQYTDQNQTTVDEDEWWILVDVEKERIDQFCEADWCFSFACRCRREALSTVQARTGVSYAQAE